MADWEFDYDVTGTATIKLSEPELRALDMMTKWGLDAFIKPLSESLSVREFEHHKPGFRKLFESIDTVCPKAINAIDDARRLLMNGGVPDTKLLARAETDNRPH